MGKIVKKNRSHVKLSILKILCIFFYIGTGKKIKYAEMWYC